MTKEVFVTVFYMLAAAFLVFYLTSCQEQRQNKNFHPHTKEEINQAILSCRPICQDQRLDSLIFDDDGTIHCNCE